jgi:hypothetical protein
MLRPTVSRPVCLVSRTHLGLTTKFLLLSDSCGFVDVGRSVWRENGFAVYNYCWSSPAQSFSGPSPGGLVTIFYCLRFDTPPTWRPGPKSKSKSKSKLCYDRRFSRPVCLGIKHPSGAYDQIFITVRQMQACWCGALSLTRGRVCPSPDSVRSNTSLVSMYKLHVTSY